MHTHLSLHAELAELALESASRAEYRKRTLDRICGAGGFDAGAIHHVSVAGTLSGETWGHAPRATAHTLDACMPEVRASEWERTLQARTVTDDLVFTAERRDELRLYRDFLKPDAIYGFAVRAIASSRGLVSICFSRAGQHHARLDDEALLFLDAVVPLVSVGEALHQGAPAPVAVFDRRAWTRQHRVTDAEHRVLELVERGLTSGEVATVLGTSVNTVRNQTGAVMRKLGASTRTELVFLYNRLCAEPSPTGDLRELQRLLRTRLSTREQRPEGPSI